MSMHLESLSFITLISRTNHLAAIKPDLLVLPNLMRNFVLKVSMLPESDRWNETRSQLLAQMDVSMGGRVAEELIFGSDHITTG